MSNRIGRSLKIALGLVTVVVPVYCFIVFIRNTPEIPVPVDNSLLSADGCSLPCWHGLEPGKTTKAEVLNAIPNISFIPRNSIIEPRDPSQPDDSEVIHWEDSLKRFNYMVLKKGYLHRLVIYPNFKVKLQEIFAAQGIPEGVYVRIGGLPGTGKDLVTFSLYYPKKALMITLVVSQDKIFNKPETYLPLPNSEMDVSFQIVTPTSSLLELVMSIMGSSLDEATEFINTKVITNWRGEDAIIYFKDDLSFSGLLLTSTPKP